MREILFKAKRLDNGEWVHGSFVTYKSMAEGCDMHIIVDGDGNIYGVDRKTLCQYTGLPDKNGVKIFDGDKCTFKSEVDGEETEYIAFWDDDDCSFSVRDKEFGAVDVLDTFFSERCTVSGNIHDEVTP